MIQYALLILDDLKQRIVQPTQLQGAVKDCLGHIAVNEHFVKDDFVDGCVHFVALVGCVSCQRHRVCNFWYNTATRDALGFT